MFGQKLQQLRTNAGLTQEALARKVGVGVEAIQKWETGGGEPGENGGVNRGRDSRIKRGMHGQGSPMSWRMGGVITGHYSVPKHSRSGAASAARNRLMAASKREP